MNKIQVCFLIQLQSLFFYLEQVFEVYGSKIRDIGAGVVDQPLDPLFMAIVRKIPAKQDEHLKIFRFLLEGIVIQEILQVRQKAEIVLIVFDPVLDKLLQGRKQGFEFADGFRKIRRMKIVM